MVLTDPKSSFQKEEDGGDGGRVLIRHIAPVAMATSCTPTHDNVCALVIEKQIDRVLASASSLPVRQMSAVNVRVSTRFD